MDDELQLDGCIISAIFDKNLDIGVVGTTSGTIWYINWDERTSIRLISGHKEQVCIGWFFCLQQQALVIHLISHLDCTSLQHL